LHESEQAEARHRGGLPVATNGQPSRHGGGVSRPSVAGKSPGTAFCSSVFRASRGTNLTRRCSSRHEAKASGDAHGGEDAAAGRCAPRCGHAQATRAPPSRGAQEGHNIAAAVLRAAAQPKNPCAHCGPFRRGRAHLNRAGLRQATLIDADVCVGRGRSCILRQVNVVSTA
jgi:hypothetical protein